MRFYRNYKKYSATIYQQALALFRRTIAHERLLQIVFLENIPVQCTVTNPGQVSVE